MPDNRRKMIDYLGKNGSDPAIQHKAIHFRLEPDSFNRRITGYSRSAPDIQDPAYPIIFRGPMAPQKQLGKRSLKFLYSARIVELPVL